MPPSTITVIGTAEGPADDAIGTAIDSKGSVLSEEDNRAALGVAKK